jgi:hypothetical protein
VAVIDISDDDRIDVCTSNVERVGSTVLSLSGSQKMQVTQGVLRMSTHIKSDLYRHIAGKNLMYVFRKRTQETEGQQLSAGKRESGHQYELN